MNTIESLIRSIESDIESIRNDFQFGTSDSILRYLDNADNYLLAPDLNDNTWEGLSAEDKESFHLFIVINELHHYRAASKDLLINAAKFFPKDTSLHLRLKLAGRLFRMNHVQNQYEQLAIEFLEEANTVFQFGDIYIGKEGNRKLLLGYFNTFVQNSRECLSGLGQTPLLEHILPEIAMRLDSNVFIMNSMIELISIVKGTFDRTSIQVNFCAPVS